MTKKETLITAVLITMVRDAMTRLKNSVTRLKSSAVIQLKKSSAVIQLRSSAADLKNSWPYMPTTANLFKAVASNDAPLVARLLRKAKTPADGQESALDVNAQSPDTGWSVLHLAALSGKPEIAQILLENGANAAAQDKMGRTALQLAEQHGARNPLLVVLRGQAYSLPEARKPRTSLDLIFNRPASTMKDAAFEDLKNQHNLKGLKRLRALIY